MSFDEKKAERLARAIASDISIYNQSRIREGIENDSLFEVLADDLSEGLKAFRQRAGDEAADTNMFERAIIDIVIASQNETPSKIF